MSKVELDQIKTLQQQFQDAITASIQNGDLSRAHALKDEIQDKINQIEKSIYPYPVYQIKVNYHQTTLELIEVGQYSYVSGVDNNYYPKLIGRHQLKISLFPSKYMIYTQKEIDDEIGLMKSFGFRPANLHELLSLGNQWPSVPWDKLILALGSIKVRKIGDNDHLCAPCLSNGKLGKSISVSSLNGFTYWHFAAVKQGK